MVVDRLLSHRSALKIQCLWFFSLLVVQRVLSGPKKIAADKSTQGRGEGNLYAKGGGGQFQGHTNRMLIESEKGKREFVAKAEAKRAF